ncbi:MAG: aspartate-semialdehyde dehydrogenase [Candidatus Kapaibacteriales bacterium]
MNYKNPRIAIAGATGLVGRTMLKVLEEQAFPYSSIKLLASPRSAGTNIKFKGESLVVEELKENSFEDIDIALFSCGGETSKVYAPFAVKSGAYVIDNSSAWRMDNSKSLVVPEVNSHHIPEEPSIIANPNCSTIQMVVTLKPIADLYGLRKVICSTYQSISGAGQTGMDKLERELSIPLSDQKKDHIAYNTLFHPYQDNGHTNEEIKMMKETKKIMSLKNIDISVTCVRLPTFGGHAESIWVQTEREADLSELQQTYSESEGIVYSDEFSNGDYPTPLSVNGRDEVFISRLRKDNVLENGLFMWVVADNLRKGAATNAVQIAQKLLIK